MIDPDRLRTLLRQAKTIAVVGLSPSHDRDSHRVAAYLQAQGYRIIPVNPTADEILGERSFPDLLSVPHSIDIVDIFRRSEAVPQIVDQAIQIGAKTVWMQLGIIHEQAAARARAAGLEVVMDACLRVVHRDLLTPDDRDGPHHADED